MSLITLRARWVLPISRPAIEGGYVSISDGLIGDVGAVRPADGGRVVDLGDAAIMPGLVNPHTHLEFSALNAPLGEPGQTLPAWIRRVIGERKRGDRDARSAIAAGLFESLRSGVTTIGEIATATANWYASDVPQPGIVAFQEAIGFSAQRVDSALADVESRLAAPGDGDILLGVSPHAPYTTNPRLVEQLVALAGARNLPVAMHIAESREEVEFLATGGGPFRELLEERSMFDPSTVPVGTRPFNYLRMLAASGRSRSLVVHGNYLATDEIAFLGEHRERLSVVYCPRTHAFFGHEPWPMDAMLRAGVRVALGTDSRASNPDLNLLAEASLASQRFPHVAPERWLAMMTLDAATALGLESSRGTLERGKRADLVAIALPALGVAPEEAIIRGPSPVHGVWLAGQPIN